MSKSSAENNRILKVKNLTMRFGGIMALRNVDFEVQKGEIFSLIGPNGSGKSTCINCINGLYKPTEGEISFVGNNITGIAPHKVHVIGIGRTFQNLELFTNMKVIDNVMVGLHSKIKFVNFLKLTINGQFRDAWEWSKDEAFKILDFLGIASFHNKIIGSLPYGLLKLVELARALASKPNLLLLDEPSAGMNSQETYEMLKIIKEIRDFLDVTVILIEHNIDLVKTVSDRICVLNNGVVIKQGSPQDVMSDAGVIEVFIGKRDD